MVAGVAELDPTAAVVRPAEADGGQVVVDRLDFQPELLHCIQRNFGSDHLPVAEDCLQGVSLLQTEFHQRRTVQGLLQHAFDPSVPHQFEHRMVVALTLLRSQSVCPCFADGTIHRRRMMPQTQ
jgi:hypothetical protein